MFKLNKLFISCFILLGFLTFGCANSKKVLKETKQLERQISPAQDEVSSFEYRIGDFDELEIKVWEGRGNQAGTKETAQGTGEYRISKGDTLNISVWQWEDLKQDVIVRPDGRLSFPLVGDIVVEGLTLVGLDGIITEKLKEYIKYPEVSIMVKDFGKSKYGILKDFPQTVTVRPDGRLSFPFVEDMFVRGLTLREVDEKLTRELSNSISAPEVYVNLEKVGGKRVIVLGEVKSPGVFKPQDNARILDVIAMAGGYTKDAALGSVILVRGGLSKPKAEKINLAKILTGGSFKQDVYIQPEDIVYVPKTPISNVNYFLEQLLGPLKSSGSAVTSIREIRERTTPFLSSGVGGSD